MYAISSYAMLHPHDISSIIHVFSLVIYLCSYMYLLPISFVGSWIFNIY